MNKKNMYNINKTITQMEILNTMNLSAALTSIKKCDRYSLNKDVFDYLHYIDDNFLFVEPTVTDIRIDNKLSTKNAKFLLFSAPGATGKSTLARYISKEFGAIYWDLSKIKIGTHSFIGTILKAVGNTNYTAFMEDLNFSKALLVIDALDEAEIVSGRNMLAEFIKEINNNIENNESPCIILLSRTETAQFIISLCSENQISLQHYEIGFFNEDKAKEFLSKRTNAKTPADKECINTYYASICNHISNEEETSLLGYAPVLEAISQDINDHQNRNKFINELKDKQSYISIISNIMEGLLAREHKKVVDAFKKRCSEKHPEFNNWDNVYNVEEQLSRVLSYIVTKDPNYDNSFNNLPSALIDDYLNIIKTFVPQHPFISENFNKDCKIDFTGPAFRDFSLVKLLTSESSVFADMYIDNHYIPSRIFYDYYKLICNGVVDSEHLIYLYDSYRSRTTAKEHMSMQCLQADNGENAIVEFGMNDTHSIDDEFELNINNSYINLSQFSNVTIDLPNVTVKIGLPNHACCVQNSSIRCKKIEWCAKSIILESFPEDVCLLTCEESIPLQNHPEFEINADYKICIDIPNINDFYKLIPYRFDLNSINTNGNIELIKFANALRNIMIEFRTHRKDTLAKDAERIDNVTIGNSEIKKLVFLFLLEKQIVYREEHLYKINMERMNTSGLNYWDLRNLNTDGMQKVYQEFISYTNKKPNK